MRVSLRQHTLMAAALLLAAMLRPAPASAQSASESTLKAAFLYNFAKFAEWPSDAPPADPLMICVVGDSGTADALDDTVKGRTIDGRKVIVSRPALDNARSCHVLYLGGFDGKRAQQIVDDMKNAPVLTVGDREQFAQGGGIAGLFVEQGRMRFAINVEAAQRCRVRVSSRLLSLAKIVKDDRAHP
jgi:hypothetical protein